MTTIFKTMMMTSLRDKITLFYSVLFPIGLLAGLGYYFDNDAYTPKLLTGVISLSTIFWGVSGIAFQVHWQRSRGVFKLLKLTPYPIMAFIFLMTAARTVIGVIINLLVLLAGIVLFGISVSAGAVILFTGMTVVGTLCFTCLGFFISNFANNEGQINMISNLFYLPMVFGSDAFYSLNHAPRWVIKMGELFPLQYYVHGLRSALDFSGGSLMKPLIVLVGYMIGLLVIAALTFKWEPSGQVELKKGKRKQNIAA